jgi:glycosyltransferase involved in cell wall biosynthesis
MVTLVEEYLRRGHEVSVFTLDPSLSVPVSYRSGRLAIHVGRYRARHRARDFFALERSDLKRFMEQDRCDIIHAQWTYEFALAAISSAQPCVVTAHDAPLAILRLQPDMYRFMRLLMAAKVCRSGVTLTAVSPYLEKHLKRVLRCRGPITIVPNGLPDSLFAWNAPSMRKSVGQGVTFGMVLTGWGGIKNGKAGLLAYREARKRIPRSRLMMFGAGYGSGEKAEAWGKQQGLTEDVTFEGKLPHRELLEELGSEIDVLVHPSREEACPVSITEAMALAVPVIGGKHSGGVPYTLEGGRCGKLVDVENPNEIAEAMIELAVDPNERRRLGHAGRESARRRFRISSVADQYESVYKRVLGSEGIID